MKLVLAICCLVISGPVLLFTGCKERVAAVDATQPLAQSFEAAQPEIKLAIGDVNRNLKAGNYLEAGRALDPVLGNRDLTPPQRQAIGLALQQLKQAIDANPALESKEMYELRAKMFRAASGSRF